MTIALIDDGRLGPILRDGSPGDLAGHEVFTTGLWYVRLCTAVLIDPSRRGSLSGPFSDLGAPRREDSLRRVERLPDEIGLVGLRVLGPVIAKLRPAHALNLLAIEALAAAITLEATVFLSTPSPRLEAALEAEGVACRLL